MSAAAVSIMNHLPSGHKRYTIRQYIFTMMFCISCQEAGYKNLEDKCFEKDLQLAGLEERALILTRTFLK